MSIENNLNIANQFLARLGSGEAPETIAQMFSADLDWKIPGEAGVLLGVGHQTGRSAIINFLRESSHMIERIAWMFMTY